jgi:hypothetical protein
MHRSALGKNIYMSAMVSQNEKVRAVGNMNVNARGDIIDSHGRVVQGNTQRVNSMYKQTVRPPSNIQEDSHEIVEPVAVPPTPDVVTEVIATELNSEEQKMFEEFDDYEEIEEVKQIEIEKPTKAKK